ncbi:cytochrome P450 6B2-like [Penaeus monodon]|uniref:cytochrome P450 6B2-like n=1 Tax=Penaeus monodon TaxID=6687 RepID=UPI0018A733EB|nr:cytochrome P450 6B2-like [Penaeus monodon]
MVADLGILSQILIKDFPAFANRARHHLATKPYCDMLVDKRDQEWKMLRTLINPVFSLAKLKQMLPLMQDCVDDFLGVVSDYVDGGRDFDIFSLSQGFTLDVIGRCALAMRIDCQRNQKRPASAANSPSRFFSNSRYPLSSSWLWWLRLWLRWLRCFRGTTTSALVEARVISNLNEVICRRRNTPGNSVDFLQLLIDASDEGADDSFRLEMLDPSSHPPAQESSSAPLGTTSSSSSLLQPSRSSPPPEDDHNCMVDTCCR